MFYVTSLIRLDVITVLCKKYFYACTTMGVTIYITIQKQFDDVISSQGLVIVVNTVGLFSIWAVIYEERLFGWH